MEDKDGSEVSEVPAQLQVPRRLAEVLGDRFLQRGARVDGMRLHRRVPRSTARKNAAAESEPRLRLGPLGNLLE